MNIVVRDILDMNMYWLQLGSNIAKLESRPC